MISDERLKRLPKKTGVYIFKDKAGKALYIGKAQNLRKRVASYFGGGKTTQPLAGALAPKTEDVDCIVTDTEKEALLLENNLIKEARPRYNINLKDDKTYVHIRLSVQEPWPRLTIVRRPRKDGSRYFGPYSSAGAAGKTARFLQKLFPLRDCTLAEFRSRARPCIKYQIERCSGPCCGLIGKGEHEELVRRVVLFLSGKAGDLLRLLDTEMRKEAGKLNYERAEKIKGTIEAIRATVEKQKCVSSDEADRDVIGIYREGGEAEVVILCVRGGKLIGIRKMSVKGARGDSATLIRESLLRYYLGGAFIPEDILLPVVLEDGSAIEAALSEERGKQVRCRVPRRGDKRKLLEMASANARASFGLSRRREAEVEELLGGLQVRLKLPKIPRRIECVDISTTAGREAVGSIVSFRDGASDKDGYRRYSIKTVEGADDCAMIYEVLSRRLRRGIEEDDLPEMILLDGGKGQLQAALRALNELKLKQIAVVAIAKERSGEGEGKKPDRLFIEKRKNPIYLKGGDRVSLFLQRVRDEAHRFALAYHRKKRDKQLLLSELNKLQGIGNRRSALLLRKLGDAEAVAQASLEELVKILRNRKIAKRVYCQFHAHSAACGHNQNQRLNIKNQKHKPNIQKLTY